jgi:hypothetical protein
MHSKARGVLRKHKKRRKRLKELRQQGLALASAKPKRRRKVEHDEQATVSGVVPSPSL